MSANRFFLFLMVLALFTACTPQATPTLTATSTPQETSVSQDTPTSQAYPTSQPTPTLQVYPAAQATPTTQTIPTSQANSFTDNSLWIAYQTTRTGSESVWLIHPDGTDDHQLDFTGIEVNLPSWSPDGNRIVVASRGGDKEPLYEYDLTTDTFRQLFACEDPCLGDDEPVYSPDGSQVLFTRYLSPVVHSDVFRDDVPSDCGLWIGDIATGEVRQITSNTNPACDREYSSRWSPDGTQIVYCRDPYENGQPTGTSVYVMNADGTNERQLTDPSMFACIVDWSPDGEWIVFDTYPLIEFNFTPRISNLYRIHPDGSGLEQLTFNEDIGLRSVQPRYTPDGKWIIFTSVTMSSRHLWVIPAEGGEPIVVVVGGQFTHSAMQP